MYGKTGNVYVGKHDLDVGGDTVDEWMMRGGFGLMKMHKCTIKHTSRSVLSFFRQRQSIMSDEPIRVGDGGREQECGARAWVV